VPWPCIVDETKPGALLFRICLFTDNQNERTMGRGEWKTAGTGCVHAHWWWLMPIMQVPLTALLSALISWNKWLSEYLIELVRYNSIHHLPTFRHKYIYAFPDNQLHLCTMSFTFMHPYKQVQIALTWGDMLYITLYSESTSSNHTRR